MAIETKRIDDASIPLVTDLNGVTIPVMQGGVSKRLMADNLVEAVVEYTHNGNTVIDITALNLETGVFTTSSPHGLKVGENIWLNFKDVNSGHFYYFAPFEIQSATYNTRPFVPVVHSTPTPTTFTLRNIQNNSDLLFNINGTANSKVDISRFHFEKITPFTVSGFSLNECTVRLGVISPQHPQGEIGVSGYTTYFRLTPTMPFNYMTYFIQLQRINGVLQGIVIGAGSGSRTNPTSGDYEWNIQSPTILNNVFPSFGGESNTPITSFTFNLFRGEFLNGTKITILR